MIANKASSHYTLGRDLFDQYWSSDPSYGRYLLSGVRKAMQATRTSQEQLDIQAGFYERMYEFNKMSFDELLNFNKN